jgi:hypothetical protein
VHARFASRTGAFVKAAGGVKARADAVEGRSPSLLLRAIRFAGAGPWSHFRPALAFRHALVGALQKGGEVEGGVIQARVGVLEGRPEGA